MLGDYERPVNRYGISFGGDKNVPKLIVVMVAQLCEILKTTELYTVSG